MMIPSTDGISDGCARARLAERRDTRVALVRIKQFLVRSKLIRLCF